MTRIVSILRFFKTFLLNDLIKNVKTYRFIYLKVFYFCKAPIIHCNLRRLAFLRKKSEMAQGPFFHW